LHPLLTPGTLGKRPISGEDQIMADAKPKRAKQRPEPPAHDAQPGGKADHPVEQDPAVERGERLDTGKTIARGGKEKGSVPGATEQPTT